MTLNAERSKKAIQNSDAALRLDGYGLEEDRVKQPAKQEAVEMPKEKVEYPQKDIEKKGREAKSKKDKKDKKDKKKDKHKKEKKKREAKLSDLYDL